MNALKKHKNQQRLIFSSENKSLQEGIVFPSAQERNRCFFPCVCFHESAEFFKSKNILILLATLYRKQYANQKDTRNNWVTLMFVLLALVGIMSTFVWMSKPVYSFIAITSSDREG